MRFVFDIDDTISTSIERDYANAIPHIAVIEKINMLYDQGHEIVLYTARGQKSCNGDLIKIREKNENILKEWLSKNNVKYTELLFGKPLGDVYVDDKCMEVREFLNSKFESLSGGSSSKIYHYGKYIKKDLKTHEAIINFRQWNEEKPDWLLTPHVISYLYNEVYLDYVEGIILCDIDVENVLNYLIHIPFLFSKYKYNTFDINYHIEKLKANNIDNMISAKVELCKRLLLQHEKDFIKHASFCHGDFTLCNMILHNNDIYFIDPLGNKQASTYLIDFAKFRMSLQNYEYNFKISNRQIDSQHLTYFDTILKQHNIYDLVIILEYMQIIRTYRYKSEEERPIVLKMLNEVEGLIYE